MGSDMDSVEVLITLCALMFGIAIGGMMRNDEWRNDCEKAEIHRSSDDVFQCTKVSKVK